jgi:glycosyltransferase involved in cell wall biosynthesis
MTLSYLCGMLRTARRILRTEAIDLIHSAWVIPSGFAGVVLKRRYRKPLVIVAHGSDLNVWKDRLLPGLFIRNVLRRADHLITIGHSLKERARECGMPEERISPILCGSGGINLADYAGEPSDHALRDRLGVAPHHLVGLVVARIQPPKRFDLMIDAALRVRAQYPDFTLLIVGGESHECARLVPMPASWQDAVMFAGAQPQERVKDFLHIADLFVYASDHEGIPSGILEALAAGLPVVASRVGGIPEIIRDGHTGFLVPNDAGVFADRMLHLCRHPDLRAEMGRAARRFAEEMLSHERLIPRIETIYAGAIRQTAR